MAKTSVTKSKKTAKPAKAKATTAATAKTAVPAKKTGPKIEVQTPAQKTSAKSVVAEILHHDEESPTDLQPVALRDQHRSGDEVDDEESVDSDDNLGDNSRDKDAEISGDDAPSALLPAARRAEAGALATPDPIQAYLAEIRKYPLLSKEQEQELAKHYFETKDPKAAQALVTANLRFVVKVAAEYSKFGARLIDLVQEGNMGLMHAVKDFNPYKGVRLITYAVWWIRGYIQEYLMKQYSLVKIGTTHNQKKLFYQLQKQARELEAMGQKPNVKLIAERLGLPEDEVMEMSQRMSGRDLSLDQPTDPDTKTTMKDMQRGVDEGPEELLGHAEELSELSAKIASLRPTLNDREIILLEERILADEPLTLQEIGEKYGITREAVRQAEVRLMKKIKDLYT